MRAEGDDSAGEGGGGEEGREEEVPGLGSGHPSVEQGHRVYCECKEQGQGQGQGQEQGQGQGQGQEQGRVQSLIVKSCLGQKFTGWQYYPELKQLRGLQQSQ